VLVSAACHQLSGPANVAVLGEIRPRKIPITQVKGFLDSAFCSLMDHVCRRRLLMDALGRGAVFLDHDFLVRFRARATVANGVIMLAASRLLLGSAEGGVSGGNARGG